MGFFTVLFIVLVSLWVLRRLSIYFLLRWVSKKQQQFGQQFKGGTNGGSNGGHSSSSGRSSHKKEGEIFIEKTTTADDPKPIARDMGDYVDYQELEQ